LAGVYLSFSVAFVIFNIIRNQFFYYTSDIPLFNYIFSQKLILEQILVPLGMIILAWFSGYYNQAVEKSRLQELTSTIATSAIGAFILFLLMLLNDKLGRRRDNYQIILILFGLFFIFSYGVRLIITSYSIKKFRRHQWKNKTIFIGDKNRVKNIIRRLNSIPTRSGVELIGLYSLSLKKKDPESDAFNEKTGKDENKDSFVEPTDGERVREEIRSLCQKGKVDQIIIVSNGENDKKVMQALYCLFELDIPIKIAPDEFSFITTSIRLSDIYAEPLIDLTSSSMSESSKNIKRTFDIVLSFLALLLLFPFLLIIAIAVKLSSEGPVFYSQERIGYRHKPFEIHKFRSMYIDAEANGPKLSSDNDTRITPFGKWMRKYRIDELPQFWNVLKGEMSIVGPRPERAYFIQRIVTNLPYYTLLSQVRPGITSWGMVKYGYAKDVEEMIKRAKFDLIYISNMSLAMDVKILIYTIKTILTGKGV
ncbi:MAG: sugar transferase, partial [Muribaculaceae bacterium]|nr:sugar transferase [Muribaculaceae bacterium]